MVGQIRRWLAVATVVVGVWWLLMATPVNAQLRPVPQWLSRRVAAVVVDGRPLFDLRDSGSLSGVERADWANQLLARAIDQWQANPEQPPVVQIVADPSTNQWTLRLNDQHLLTVTQADIGQGGRSARVQAEIWQQEIQNALQQARLERTPAYHSQALVFAVVTLVLAGLGHIVLSAARRWFVRYLTRLTHATAPHLEGTLRLISQMGFIGIQSGIWLAVLLYLTDLFPTIRIARYYLVRSLVVGLTTPIVTLGNRGYSLLDLLTFLVLFVLLWTLSGTVAGLLKSRVLQVAGADQRVREVVAVLTRYTLVLLGSIILLQIWGLDVTSLTLLASVLGVGIGFGLQNTANNFISGLIITLERPIQVGDFINVGDLQGTVERIGTRTTEIRTLDRVSIIVPNSRFVDNQVINWSLGSPVSRLHVPVGVAYGSPVETVRTALLEAARRHPDVLANPAPQVWLVNFGESAMMFDLLVWICEPREQYRIKSDLYYRIVESFQKYNIKVPFPQRDVHIHGLEKIIPPSPESHGAAGMNSAA
ncbi:MAG: mechanosensitive ion channel [Gloeomargarita sp. SKYBB_i_bin120]|nr:mechanosensitive ion channel [Gloeomargarita sp. SKYB120]MDW8178625.1 mechanosensitive ion channel [Gloeomargarita sp. SKYBB_i_bin120]